MKLQFTRLLRMGAMALGISGIATATVSGVGKTILVQENTHYPSKAPDRNASRAPRHQDVQFFNDMAGFEFRQIALGALAIEKGSTDDIKDYGRHLIESHVNSLQRLMDLSSRKDVFIPLDQIKPPVDQLAQLGQKSGSEFDRAFIIAAINDETTTQIGLQRFLEQVQDIDIRDFANHLLSNASDRLSDARALGGNLGIASREMNPPPVAEQTAPESTPERPTPSPTPSPTMQ